MIRAWRLSFAAIVGVSAACADDGLTRRAPKLEVTAHPVEACTDGTYDLCDDAALLIDLGQVPVFATKYAVFKMENPTAVPLEVSSVTYTTVEGHLWKDPAIEPNPQEARFKNSPEVDFAIGAFGSALLKIPYAPLEWDPNDPTLEHLVVATIESDAANADTTILTVKGRPKYTGEPDIEVEYGAFVGPNAAECTDTDGDGAPDAGCCDEDSDGLNDWCKIRPTNALDFGNIGLGSRGTARLIIRNIAECLPVQGVNVCSLCELTVAKDPTRQNLGLNFKPGTNDDGLFSFSGSNATPFEIRQRSQARPGPGCTQDSECTPSYDCIGPSSNKSCGCDEQGHVRLLITFDAPETEGEHHAVIVLEANDPDEPLIEIPVTASARNAPIAIAKFREFNPVSPTDPYTDPAHIEPLTTVYFDGRNSYDPAACPSCADLTSAACASERAATPGCAIGAWQWEVEEFPAGTDPGMFNLQGQTTNLFGFWLPLAGHYVVKLTVTNTSGIQSGDTPQSRVEFDVIPGSALHVQNVWDNATNDQDLHLVYVDEEPLARVCNIPWDCHWRHEQPAWFPVPSLANPTLDIDDTNGLGPENINIDVPEPGIYRIFVHYFGDFTLAGVSPTRETVRIFLNGLQVAEYRRTLTQEKAVWAVADITWLPDGTGFVTPYPSDTAGEIGSVAVMQTCNSPGWTFP